MEKKVLMFHRDAVCYNSVNFFSERIADGLHKHHIAVKWLDITTDSQQLSFNLTELIQENKFNAAIAVNTVGQELYRLNGNNLYDELGIPFFNLLLDHPTAHLSSLTQGPTDYRVICIDREHKAYIDRYLSNIKSTYFIPLGPSANNDIEDDFETYMEREIDLLFTGANKRLDKIEENILNLPPLGRSIVTEEIEYFLDNRDMSLDKVLYNVLKARGIDSDDTKEYFNYSVTLLPAQQYCMAYLREEIIRYLIASGINLYLCGDGWEEIISDYSAHNTTALGDVPYNRTSELCRKSKLTLNIMPLFRDGSHDRIPTSLANGAAVLSDPTLYLKDIFSSNEGLYFYDISHPELIPELTHDLLSDPETLYSGIVKGRQKVEQYLSWEVFVKKLTGFL